MFKYQDLRFFYLIYKNHFIDWSSFWGIFYDVDLG